MLNLFPSLKCIPDSPLQGDSGDWEFGLHPFLLCQAISQYYKPHFLLFWVIQIKGKTVKFPAPCTTQITNRQINISKTTSIFMYTLKWKYSLSYPMSLIPFSSFLLSTFLSLPWFLPSKSKLPLLCTPAVMDAVLISDERLSLPLCLPSNDNTDVLNILTYSFPTGKCSPSPSNPSVPPPWPVSVSFQHPAVGGMPLSLYNLNCQTALRDSRWVKKQQN